MTDGMAANPLFFGGLPEMPWHTQTGVCQIRGCGGRSNTDDLCDTHYERRRKYGNFHSKGQGRRKSKGLSMVNTVLREYQRGAERRDLEWALMDGYAEALMRANCHYCGCPPARFRKTAASYGGFAHNGLDRKDNTVGYVRGNVVSCCTRCNEMKATDSYEDFLARIERIYSERMGVR